MDPDAQSNMASENVQILPILLIPLVKSLPA
jgi:hypothetical protein